jgi:hypothetical protein
MQVDVASSNRLVEKEKQVSVCDAKKTISTCSTTTDRTEINNVVWLSLCIPAGR